MLPFKRILCPTDFSEPSSEALRVGSEMALHFGAEVLVVHIVPPLPTPADMPHGVSNDIDVAQKKQELDAGEAIKDAVATFSQLGLRAQGIVRVADPADGIVRVASEEKTDLIIIATHGRTGWRRLVFGSVAEKVVRNSRCPVLTVHEPNP